MKGEAGNNGKNVNINYDYICLPGIEQMLQSRSQLHRAVKSPVQHRTQFVHGRARI